MITEEHIEFIDRANRKFDALRSDIESIGSVQESRVMLAHFNNIRARIALAQMLLQQFLAAAEEGEGT